MKTTVLEGSRTIFSAGSFKFEARHLLVIGILAIAFTTAFIMRSYPSKYGFYLNEFDPYFDYRATQYLLDHGLDAYLKWHDTMTWYPEGRDIAATSQSALHMTTAFLYKAFGGGMSLLDFTIILPVVVGSLTVIVVFALVRVLAGTTAGLFSALLFAFSPAIIERGNLGWFKSEPLGLFYGLIAVYLFISAIKHKEVKYAIPKAIAGGFFLAVANGAWGGIEYFSIPISFFLIALPFFRKDTNIPMYVAIAFTVATLLSILIFPRPGLLFVKSLPGFALLGGTIFLVIANFVKRFSGPHRETRNLLYLLIAFVALAVGVTAAGAYSNISFRYLNAVNPFLSTQNPLVESVAEHFTPTIADYFTDYSILLMFAGLGVWMAFRRRNDMSVFALILGFTAVYVSATFARLLVYASIGIIVLGGIGLYEVTRSVLDYRAMSVSSSSKNAPTKRVEFASPRSYQPGKYIRISYAIVIIMLLSVPMFYPINANWVSSADVPASIANGGTGYRTTTSDWTDALNWIKANTPPDSKIAAWWDYGYWITTLSNRTTYVDNATLNSTKIATIAKMLVDDKESGLQIARDIKADYIIVYTVAQRFSALNNTSFYILGQGGDESKKQWFMRIGGLDEHKYLEQDGFTPTPLFWNTTLLGHLFPFAPVSYASFSGGSLTNPSPTYQPGSVGLYVKDVKYPANGPSGQPLYLVYSSPSFNSDKPGLVFGVLVYKVNHDYMPRPTNDPYNATQQGIVPKTANSTATEKNPTSVTPADMVPSNETAVITTSQGVIKIEFFPKAAPKTVANFENLARKGFYDGTLFHRIVPGFVIQGGDPNTRVNGTDRSTWGTGGPGYSIPAEFNDISHTRGIVSMARSSDPNSGGSQFFIVLQNSTFLDRQYTAFGKVIEGMDVVDKIAKLPTMTGQFQDQPVNPNDARILSIKIEPK